jgi:hypothetical protein
MSEPWRQTAAVSPNNASFEKEDVNAVSEKMYRSYKFTKTEVKEQEKTEQ